MTSHSARVGRDRALVIELGTEPPLRSGEAPPLLDPRALSVRWLAGTVLTAIAGSLLMGGAIYSAFDGEMRFADLPHFASIQKAAESASNLSRKGDRITFSSEPAGAKTTVRVSSTTKIGDREVVRVRPYTKVTALLVSRPTEFADAVPNFNPVKLMTEADVVTAEPDSDGDLSFVVRDLASEPMDNAGPVLTAGEVLAKVRETAAFEVATRFEGLERMMPVSATATPGSYGGPEGLADFMAPQKNITPIAKSLAAGPVKADGNEIAVSVSKDTPIEGLLRDNGASPAEARAISSAFAGRDGYGFAQAGGGQTVRILFDPPSALSARPPIVRVSLFAGDSHLGSVAAADTGGYVAVADLADLDGKSDDEAADDDRGGGRRLRLYNSIYETALRQQVPQPIIDQFARIISFDVDFNRRVSSGDALELFYADDDDTAHPELLFAMLTIGGEQKKFFRFQTGDDGIVDWYDEDGRSAKKFLMRKPMNGGMMRSGFGARRHPILGYTKMHTGVDWSNPVGSPIIATGNGTVEKAGWEGGYGKYVRIQHTNGYETAYGHMSAFARGIRPGVRIRQGQIIGFVGSTGLSTGPHCHYEVLVNGRFVNPMRIKLPRGRELDGTTLTAFNRERERVETLLGNPGGATVALGRSQGG